MKKLKSFLIALFVMMTVTNFAYAAPYGGSENSGGGVFVNGGGQGFSWSDLIPQIIRLPGQVLGASTTATITPVISPTFTITIDQNLRFGSRGIEVVQLQEVLIEENDAGFTSPTGYFGAATLAAVRRFQAQNGIPQTGFVGPLTRNAIANLQIQLGAGQ